MRLSAFILAFTIISCTLLQAQKIKYESSFENAKKSAFQQKKPLAFLITIQPPVYSPDFMKGLNDEKVIEIYSSSFINFKADRADTAASGNIIKKYNIYRFPSLLFFDAFGGFMFSDIAFVSFPQQLIDLAHRALVAYTKEKSIVEYDSAYKEGNENTAFLKDYILKRESAGITDNADLIENYINGLKVSDIANYSEVLFILKAGPYADGTAYKLVSLNKKIIDSIYKTEPVTERIAMNNAIISNTMKNAIATKNPDRANSAANFTRNTWPNDFKEGQKKWHLKMLQYYMGVKDTSMYLRNAAFYYDMYYMKISVDSVRKKETIRFEAAKNSARGDTMVRISESATIRSSGFVFAKDSYASDLNDVAWNFYQNAGNNTEYLFKAMLWSRRSIEFSPEPDFFNTYAHLLYKLKFYDEAESMERKAIETGKSVRTDTKIFQEEYEKIKKRTL